MNLLTTGHRRSHQLHSSTVNFRLEKCFTLLGALLGWLRRLFQLCLGRIQRTASLRNGTELAQPRQAR